MNDRFWEGALRRCACELMTIRRIVEELGRTVATPDEARDMLGLKGADRTGI